MPDPEFIDDDTVGDAALLLRRIPHWHFHFDKNLQELRPTSAAFDDDGDGSPMSVQIDDVLAEHGLTRESVLVGHERFALAGFPTGAARDKQLGVQRDAHPGDPAHALVFGKKTEGVRKALRTASSWVIPPPADWQADQ